MQIFIKSNYHVLVKNGANYSTLLSLELTLVCVCMCVVGGGGLEYTHNNLSKNSQP